MNQPQMQIQCPTCQTTLQVPDQMRGQVVACPKCNTQLQIAAPTPPQTAAPSPQAPPAPAAPPVATPPPIAAPPVGQAPLSPPSGLTADNVGNAPPTAGSAWSGTSSPKPTQSPKRKKKPARHHQDDEEESIVDNIGYYLVGTAILASLAPFFGLEHRALRHAGEFGPIIGILLGLVGSGLIASRGKSYSLPVAGLLAVLCLGSGIAGFVFKNNEGQVAQAEGRRLSKKEREANAKEELEQLKRASNFPGATPPKATPPADIPDFKIPGVTNNPGQQRPSPPSNRTFNFPPQDNGISEEFRKQQEEAQEEFNRQHEQMREEAQKRMNEIRNRQNERRQNRPGMNRPTTPGGNRSAPPGFPSGRGGGRGFGPPDFPGNGGGNSGRAVGNSNLAGSGTEMDMRKRNEQGLDIMRFRASGNPDLQQNYKFEKMVGSDGAFGKIFFQPAPVKAVDFANFDTGSFLMPSDPNLPEHENRLVVPEGVALVGLNLAVVNGKLVGVQGIFGKREEKRKSRYDIENTTTSKWLGQSSEQPLKTLTKGKPVHGMAIFNDIRSITGIQLITKRSQ